MDYQPWKERLAETSFHLVDQIWEFLNSFVNQWVSLPLCLLGSCSIFLTFFQHWWQSNEHKAEHFLLKLTVQCGRKKLTIGDFLVLFVNIVYGVKISLWVYSMRLSSNFSRPIFELARSCNTWGVCEIVRIVQWLPDSLPQFIHYSMQ